MALVHLGPVAELVGGVERLEEWLAAPATGVVLELEEREDLVRVLLGELRVSWADGSAEELAAPDA